MCCLFVCVTSLKIQVFRDVMPCCLVNRIFKVSSTAHTAYVTLFLLSCTCSQIYNDANSSFLLSRRCRTLKAMLQSCCGVTLIAHTIQWHQRCMVAVVVDITWLFLCWQVLFAAGLLPYVCLFLILHFFQGGVWSFFTCPHLKLFSTS